MIIYTSPIHIALSRSEPTMSLPTLARNFRHIARTILLPPIQEGPVPLRRNIGGPQCPDHRPFLLLDAVKQSGSAPAFGPHPHRGQETITYVLEGTVDHRDSRGNEGVLKTGDLQFMCAGRGVVHDETPAVDEKTGALYGVQVWVALPAEELGSEAKYSDLKAKEIPVVRPTEGVEVRVIAGEAFGVKMPLRTKGAVHYLDIRLQPGVKVELPITPGFNALAHVLGGTPTVAGHVAEMHETVLFDRKGDGVLLANQGSEAAHMLLLSGDPLDGQEIHRNGPFVSNTRKGAFQAWVDFEERKHGFENIGHMFQ